MNYVEAFAVFDRLGIPAPVGNESFILAAAEKIVALEHMIELDMPFSLFKFSEVEEGDVIVLKSDNIDESTMHKVRDMFKKKLKTEVICFACGSDDDIYKIPALQSGDLLIVKCDQEPNDEQKAAINERLQAVKTGPNGKIGILYMGPDDEVERITYEEVRKALGYTQDEANQTRLPRCENDKWCEGCPKCEAPVNLVQKA